MKTIVVLNDGETYTDIEGCTIQVLLDSAVEMVEAGASLTQVVPVISVSLTEPMIEDWVAELIEDATGQS